MADKYLEKFKRVYSETPKLPAIKGGYRKGISKTKEPRVEKHLYEDVNEFIPQENVEAENILKNTGYSPDTDQGKIGYAMAIANKLMASKRSMESTMLGAKVYEKIGQGYRSGVKRRLLRKFEKLAKKEPEHIPEYAGQIREFLERNPTREPSKLEKTAIGISIISLLASLFFLSFNVTGEVISNFSSKNAGLTGVCLSIIGFISAAFYFKIRN